MNKPINHQVFKRPMPLGELCPNNSRSNPQVKSFFNQDLHGLSEDFLFKLAVPIPQYTTKRKENENLLLGKRNFQDQQCYMPLKPLPLSRDFFPNSLMHDQFKKMSMKFFLNSNFSLENQTTLAPSSSNLNKNFINETELVGNSSGSDQASIEHISGPEIKLTSRRRNNMQKIIEDHNQARKNQLRQSLKKYYSKEAQENTSIANMLYEL
jgi:hypothetical protein